MLPGALRVCHIMSADLWAGAEVQVAAVASYLARERTIELSAVLFNDGRLADELRKLGVDLAVVDERRRTALEIVGFVARFLRARKVDIVHTHRYKDNILGATAAKLAGVSHVIRTVHGLAEPAAGWERAKVRAAEALDKAVLWCCADRVIAVSDRLGDALKRSGYPRSSLVPIHNGVDLGRVRAARCRADVRRELGIAPDAFVIGTAGRLVPVKAQASLLRAARLVLQERGDARFVIAGDGPLRDGLLRTADQLGIAGECILSGARDDIHDVIAAMDIFVLPSLHEGIPIALLEAMALCRPVVATGVGGIPEVIEDRSNGLLVPPGDDRALASACLEVARDASLAGRMGVTARQTIEARFSHEKNGAAVLATYRAVSGTPRTSDTGRPGALMLCRELIRAAPRHAWRTARRTIEAAVERRRMARIRRDPAPLIAALQSAERILIVCQGNIIRSPFAASLIARYLQHRGGVAVASAGLAAVPGKPPHPTALQLATALDVDLTAHAASPVDAQAVAASDAIFVMDLAQLVLMRKRFPEARSRTFLLTCLASDTPLEIRDPYAGDEPEFQTCFNHIARAVQPLVGVLSSAPARP